MDDDVEGCLATRFAVTIGPVGTLKYLILRHNYTIRPVWTIQNDSENAGRHRQGFFRSDGTDG